MLAKQEKESVFMSQIFVGTVVYEDEWQVAVSVKDGKTEIWSR